PYRRDVRGTTGCDSRNAVAHRCRARKAAVVGTRTRRRDCRLRVRLAMEGTQRLSLRGGKLDLSCARADASRLRFRVVRAPAGNLRARNVHCVIGGAALPNPASVALHERLGFTKVAHFRENGFKFGRWIDVAYWQRVL